MPDQFEQVDWPMVHETLHEVPRMFIVCYCKQVMGISGTNFNQPKYQQNKDPKFPSCDKYVKTCSHMLHYNKDEAMHFNGQLTYWTRRSRKLERIWACGSVWYDMHEGKGGFLWKK